jgi:hypothetical protein
MNENTQAELTDAEKIELLEGMLNELSAQYNAAFTQCMQFAARVKILERKLVAATARPVQASTDAPAEHVIN